MRRSGYCGMKEDLNYRNVDGNDYKNRAETEDLSQQMYFPTATSASSLDDNLWLTDRCVNTEHGSASYSDCNEMLCHAPLKLPVQTSHVNGGDDLNHCMGPDGSCKTVHSVLNSNLSYSESQITGGNDTQKSLFPSETLCCGYSLDSSRQDESNESPQLNVCASNNEIFESKIQNTPFTCGSVNLYTDHLGSGGNKCKSAGSMSEWSGEMTEINTYCRADMQESVSECQISQMDSQISRMPSDVGYQKTHVDENVNETGPCLSTPDKSAVINQRYDLPCEINDFISEVTQSMDEILQANEVNLEQDTKNEILIETDNFFNKTLSKSDNYDGVDSTNNQNFIESDNFFNKRSKTESHACVHSTENDIFNETDNFSSRLSKSENSDCVDLGKCLYNLGSKMDDEGMSSLNEIKSGKTSQQPFSCGSVDFPPRFNLNENSMCTCGEASENLFNSDDLFNSHNPSSQPSVSHLQSCHVDEYKDKENAYVNQEILDTAICNNDRSSMGENSDTAPIKIEFTDTDDTSLCGDGVVETELGYYWLTSTIDEKPAACDNGPGAHMEEGNSIDGVNMADQENSANSVKFNSAESLCSEKKMSQEDLISTNKKDSFRASTSKISDLINSLDTKYLSLDRIGNRDINSKVHDDFQLKSVSNENLTVRPLRKYSAPATFCKVYKVISIDIPKMDTFATLDRAKSSSQKRHSSGSISKSESLSNSGGLMKSGSFKNSREKFWSKQCDTQSDRSVNHVRPWSSESASVIDEGIDHKVSNHIIENDHFGSVLHKKGSVKELSADIRRPIQGFLERPTLFLDVKDKPKTADVDQAVQPPKNLNTDLDDHTADLNMQPTMVWDPGVLRYLPEPTN